MMAELLSCTTGMDIDETEILRKAKKIVNLIRSYNVREGLRRKDDKAPEFHFYRKPPAHLSISADSSDSHDSPDSDDGSLLSVFGNIAREKDNVPQVLDRNLLNKHIDRWYQVKGWDSEGIPTKETLTESGLDYVKQDLENRGIVLSRA